MAKQQHRIGFALVMALSGSIAGCHAVPPPPGAPTVRAATLRGSVTFAASPRGIQAEMSEVGNAATVSLLDATTGNTLGSSVTDASGNFVLSFDTLIPTNDSTYVLEAVKGLAVGGNPNRAGASAVRVRTLLFWDNGWKSLTNSTPGTGIVVSAATTAVSTIVSLKKNAGTTLTLANLIGKINPSDNTFNEGGTGLNAANDYAPVLVLVQNALQLDQDPVGAIGFDVTKGAYALTTGVPLVGGFSPAVPNPGGIVTVKGAGFDRLDGRNVFWVGTTVAATWSVSADKTTATVTWPATAYSGPFLLQQPGGTYQTLSPFLPLHGTVGTLVGNGIPYDVDGTGTNAQLNRPFYLALDAAGNLYMAETTGQRVRKVSPGGVLTTLAGSGTAGFANGTGTGATFSSPKAVAVDASGNLYVTDAANHCLRKITPAGAVSTLAGTGTAGSADGAGTAATFSSPEGLAIDASGNLYVADRGNHKIRMVTSAGVVSTIAGGGTAGATDGTGGAALFNNPVGIALDAGTNLYVTDYIGNRIRKVAPGGIVTTLAGNGTGVSLEGTGTTAQFNGPAGIAVDPSGNLYVTEWNGHKIRKLTPGMVSSTLAGTGTAGWLDGALTSAQFNNPTGLVLDSAGNLYVGDSATHRIRVVTP